MVADDDYLRQALRLARRGYRATSPNPMVGALVVKNQHVLGRGWHRAAGQPHAEVEAILNARSHGHDPRGTTLYVTLEPCCTHGRTPPCTDAIIEAGIKRVVFGAIDPNPAHAGRALKILKRAGVQVRLGVLADECARLNEAFNHWIAHQTPLVIVKAAMTLDGKIATASGQSKWITSPQARDFAMTVRRGVDAVLVGINTILTDDPSLTIRNGQPHGKGLRRIVLDAKARTPLSAKVVSDNQADLTTIIVSPLAPPSRVAALTRRVQVMTAPVLGRGSPAFLDLPWVLKQLGAQQVTSLLVEGGGEVNASFLLQHLAHRVAFFYAPKIFGGRAAAPAVGGHGISDLKYALRLTDVLWRALGPDWLLTAGIM